MLDERKWREWTAWSALGATAANFASIAAAHSILGAGLGLLLLRPRAVRLPRVAWPLIALLVWTLVSAAASDDPAAALPQVKKLYVFAILPLAYTALRTADMCRRVTEAWFVVLVAACGLAIAEFGASAAQELGRGGDFHGLLIADRIRGFYSHWMTFSQAATLGALTLACYLLYGRRRPGSGIWFACGVVMAVALVLSFTRSAWLALLAGGLYLLAGAKPRTLALVPVAAVALYFCGPSGLQERIRSIRPEANHARILMWRTGLNMIAAHPLLGVGPERVGPRFEEFQPEGVEELPPGFYGHLHNLYIHYAAERGLPAALIVLWLFGQVLFDTRRGLTRLPEAHDDRRFLLQAGATGTLAMAVLSCFDVTLGDSEVLAAFLALAAVAYRGLAEIPSGSSAE
ncbi:MAG: O-antigen ligase family protein [Bryobacterales bacterium]|nr:O-antigen ligase family protein [Bryobacterales bacterium]